MKTKFPILGIGLSLMFLLLGNKLINNENNYTRILGYIVIIFFVTLILIALVRLFKNK